ncbi:hypothetical protein [Methylophilus sp. DW102]|uniref:hypothetical protein n=1 Tax=Methylophilus sp. DW102 TaxID=3095607 RepID=UPI0030859A98|nr:hypothetical protein MTDW_01740 [Methylophilus sp. DW102]
MHRVEITTDLPRSYSPVVVIGAALFLGAPVLTDTPATDATHVKPVIRNLSSGQRVYVDEQNSTYYNFSKSPTGQVKITNEPTFEHTVQQFYTTLLSGQEPLGKEFEQVLFDNLIDLYES